MANETQAPDIKALEKRFITIASGKGGVGKTWLSVTLAHALSHLNKKGLDFRICVLESFFTASNTVLLDR